VGGTWVVVNVWRASVTTVDDSFSTVFALPRGVLLPPVARLGPERDRGARDYGMPRIVTRIAVRKTEKEMAMARKRTRARTEGPLPHFKDTE
jgi:hypothetical protein